MPLDPAHIPPRLRALGVFALLLAAAGVVAWLLAPLLVPILLSFVLYAVLEPVSSALARRGFGRNVAALAVLAGLGVGVAVAIAYLFPHFAGQLQQLNERLPVLWEALGRLAEDLAVRLEASFGVAVDPASLTDPITSRGQEWAQQAIIQGTNLLLSTTATLLLLPLFTFFLIRDWKGLRSVLLGLLPNRSFELGWLIYYRVARQLQLYVRGVMIQSGIMAAITATGFFLVGVDSPLLLGLLAGILNLIPYVGPLLAMVPPVVLVLGDAPLQLWMAGAAVGVVVVGQLVDNLLVVPGVIANVVNLHPLIVIGGVIVFGNFFGFLGMILAIPALSTANILLTGLLNGLRAREVSEA
jgi:putative permease